MWLALHSQAQGVEVHPLIQSFSDLIHARNVLFEQARGTGADWILWIDADHQFPANGLLQLLRHGLEVVGANYPRRTRPAFPTAIGEDGKPLWTTREKKGLEPVATMGLGFCLTKVSTLAALDPVFMAPHDDAVLFRRLREQGVTPYVDHALSWHVGHVTTQVLTNEIAEFDRIEFNMRQRAAE